jgi:hypothetical protein
MRSLFHYGRFSPLVYLGIREKMGKEGSGSWHQCQRKVPVILRSLPKADDEESDRQRQILRYAQDDGLIGLASLGVCPGVGSRNDEDFAFGIPAFAGI